MARAVCNRHTYLATAMLLLLAVVGNPAAQERLDSWWRGFTSAFSSVVDGRLPAAVHVLRAALALDPDPAASAYQLGRLLELQGKEAEAIEQYRTAVRLDPNHALALYDAGVLLQRLGESSAAIDHFRRASEIDPDNPRVFYSWGEALEAQGDAEQALVKYRQAAALGLGAAPGAAAPHPGR